jgi:hypothetical protein
MMHCWSLLGLRFPKVFPDTCRSIGESSRRFCYGAELQSRNQEQCKPAKKDKGKS